jgi:VCBS repeat-containing protein
VKRLNNMKIQMKPIAAAVALTLAAGPVWAVQDFYLAAKAFDKTLPDGTVVTMWGYAEDVGGTCYNTTTSGADRRACVDGLTASLPGPTLRLTDPTDPNIRINLTNNLPEPTSIIIPGQKLPVSYLAGGTTNFGPTWDDGSEGPRPNATARVRSFGKETPPNGGRNTYRWVAGQNNSLDTTGTLMYHSGTWPQKQVYMGLAGLVARDSAAGEIYPGVAYDNEATLFYSDIDTAFNAEVVATANTKNMTAADRHPNWFLVNGDPYDPGVTPDVAAGAAGSNTLLRLASTASDTHVAVLQGLKMTIHAEDGQQYNYQEGAVSTPAPRVQYSAMLPPAKTKDAIVVASDAGRFAVYDGNGYMTNPSNPGNEAVGDSVGGMIRFIAFGSGTNQLPVAVVDSNSGIVGDPDLTGDVLANDTAGDAPATVTAADQGGTPITPGVAFVTAAGNSLTLNANGTYSYSTANVASETFNYTITDNNGDISSSTLAITVASANAMPVANSQAAMTDEDVATAITLTASDDGMIAPLTWTVGTPANGTLDGTAPNLTYTPTANFNGTDSFTFSVYDGEFSSATATVSITVNPVNDAPVADAQSVTTDQGVAIPITLTGSDVDGDTLTYTVTVASGPANGVLNGTAPNLSYVPNAGFSGADSFTFSVNDGTLDSAPPVAVDITVNASGTAAGSMVFSTSGAGAVPGVSGPYDDADLYSVNIANPETNNVYTRLHDAVTSLGLPNNANIDGLSINGSNIYMSFAAASTTVPGLGAVQDEDVVVYDGSTWSSYFDGTVCGLDASNGLDIDALSVSADGNTLYFSTAGGGRANRPTGVTGAPDDADVYTWSLGATSCGRVLDGSAAGLPANADIDGLTVVGGTYYISFRNSAGTNVPGIAGGPVQDESVVFYNGSTWTRVFVGAGQLDGSNSQNVDALQFIP